MLISEENTIENKKELIDWFEKGCKSNSNFKIGTEHEKFVYTKDNFSPVGYLGKSGIKNVLLSLKNFGWEEIRENGNVIALKKKNQSITLEPGGQLELSGAPLENIHQTCVEVNEHLNQVKTIGTELDVIFLGLGARIDANLPSDLWMPKPRYNIMKNYMPSKGSKGLEMMADTCTVQVNLDYSSEKDMVRKVRTAFKLQPIITAIFANSPLNHMKPSKFISRRAAIWSDVDKDRCGIPKIVFDSGFGFEMWTDYALKVPMYFIRRNDKYINLAGKSFENFLIRDANSFDHYQPILQDWEDHLSTIFTEVRVKSFIEMRGADAGPWQNLCALPALWVGLLYDQTALNEAEYLSSEISIDNLMHIYNEVPKYGLKTKIKGKLLSDLANDVLQIAIEGLKRRNILDAMGNDESGFLKDLIFEVIKGRSPADTILDLYNKDKINSKTKIYDFFSY